MSRDPAPPAEARRRRRLWISLGEGAAVVAVVISALSYWDAHREHDASLGATQASQRAQAALLVIGASEDGGRRLILRPLNSAQAIQSERIVLPSALRSAPIDVAAATPAIEAQWVAEGVGKRLDATKAAAVGTGWIPVALLTTYAENGEIRSDRSLYRLGYSWQSRFLLGRRIDLLGLALIRRGVAEDPTAMVDRRWAAAPNSAPAAE